MTIFNTAYDTTACAGSKLKKITDPIDQAVVNGWLQPTNDFVSILQVTSNPDLEIVPAFAHPIIASNKVVVDVRQFGSWDKSQQVFNIRSTTEYKLLEHRAALNHLWLNDYQATLRDISPMPMGVYSSWIAESVARRFALDPREQLLLQILAAVYYNSLFSNDTEIDERNKLAITNSIVKNLKVSAQDVLDILDKVGHLTDVHSFCKEATIITESIRLKEFNAGVLFSILGGTWYGVNARELVAVAVEHPPTWLAVLLAAFEERTYKNSYITNITERRSFTEAGKVYSRAFLNITRILNEGDAGKVSVQQD
jgi:hypothetical protein